MVLYRLIHRRFFPAALQFWVGENLVLAAVTHMEFSRRPICAQPFAPSSEKRRTIGLIFLLFLGAA